MERARWERGMRARPERHAVDDVRQVLTAMKTLLILRHAKAQPDAPAGDWARKLTGRGRRDAATMGAHLLAAVGTPDAIVTSDARRARQTAEIVAKAVGFGGSLTLEPRAYGADWTELLDLVRGVPDAVGVLLLVGHNPGLEELASALAGRDAETVRLPTAGLAQLEFDATGWGAVRPGTATWRGVATPRTLA